LDSAWVPVGRRYKGPWVWSVFMAPASFTGVGSAGVVHGGLAWGDVVLCDVAERPTSQRENMCAGNICFLVLYYSSLYDTALQTATAATTLLASGVGGDGGHVLCARWKTIDGGRRGKNHGLQAIAELSVHACACVRVRVLVCKCVCACEDGNSRGTSGDKRHYSSGI